MDGALLPTTKHRRGRRTPRQEAALATPTPYLLPATPAALRPLLGDGIPTVLDIGFGTGEAVIAYAAAAPDERILAVDMHTPGIGDLLASITELGLTNVYVVEADVRIVLAECIPPASLCGARAFFPDPWPKKRHHRRRLIQSDFADLLATRVRVGGFWHIATDWADYAEQIEVVLEASPPWRGGRIDRPASRPTTRYERRGLAAGREPVDLLFDRITA